MADDSKKDNIGQDNGSQPQALNVASLSIPTIIAALHENAISKSNAASKNVKIINSAIEGTGDKARLDSAGEHIISVLSIQPNTPVDKATAIEVLKTYVQWFVGPDLAKNVTDDTVKSLVEKPANESAQMISFKQFLLEQSEEEEPPDFGDTEDKPKDSKEADKEADKEDNKEDNKEDGENPDFGTTEDEYTGSGEGSNSGWYIPYRLKVEGLKQTALKSAVKKFASTFFDNTTIKFTSLFGGGGESFTVKDVKDKLRDVFGPIDPDDLVQKVRKEIDDIRNPNTDSPEIYVRDKDTLISDLGSNINAVQKKQISSADYSLWIKLKEYDPKKAIFNPRVIADIVQSSITGLYKKFKNKITKNDVIYIENYEDQHSNTKALENLNRKVPEPSKFVSYMKSERASYSDVWTKIDDTLDKIRIDDQYKYSSLAKECCTAWETFKKQHTKDAERLSKDKPGSDVIEEYFKSFIDAYNKAYEKNKKQQDLHESLHTDLQRIVLLNHSDQLKRFVFESMFTEADETPDFTDSSDGTGSSGGATSSNGGLDPKKIEQTAIDAFARKLSGVPVKIKVGSKDSILKALEKYDLDGTSDKFGKYKNGITADFGNMMQESLKSSIMSILFEDEPNAQKPTLEQVKGVFELICRKAGINEYGSVIEVWYDASEKNANASQSKNDTEDKKMNEADGSKNKAEEAEPDAYILPFSDEIKQVANDNDDNDNDNIQTDTSEDQTKYEDLYIIPMPGLKYKDKEYDTYA